MTVQVYKKQNAKIDLKHLRCAVAAADHGSFRRAAEILNIEQSTLSRSILQLEHATSTTIFHRSPGGVVVSTLGSDFIRMARVVLEQIDEFGSPALSTLRKGLLSVGFCTSLSAGGLRSNLLDFHHRFPQFRLSMLERRRSRLTTKLQNGTLDIVISTGKLPTAKCKTQALWSERVLIALPEDHRLVDRDVVYWTDLRSETLLMSQYDPYWEFEDLVTSKLVSHDDRPRIERHDVSRSILKSLISMRLGLGLMLESDVGVRVPSIVFKELRDGTGAARVEFSAFWREANENPALAQFLRLLKERYPVLS
jgi:DNA-binding transcriptional LysR family regulator